MSTKLKKRELLSREVLIDGVKFTVSEMTVGQRTRFELILNRRGFQKLREALLICCVACEDGSQAFDPDQYADQVGKDCEDPEAAAVDLLVDDLATWPADQLQPLYESGYEVNNLGKLAAAADSHQS